MGTEGAATKNIRGGEADARGPSDALDPTLEPGTQVGEWTVVRALGAGGSASVYEAVDATGGSRVALKVLHRRASVDPRAVARFDTEARIVGEIGHPNIVEVRGHGELPDGRRYHVVELVSGPTLERLLADRGRLGAGEALPILRGIAAALQAAHDKGVAHRDLKPDNVLLATGPAGSFVPRLADFGLAKLAAPAERAASATETGTIMGTPHYMAPEQARSGGGVDARADIYAFGVLAYRVLVGQLPFTGEDPLDVLLKHRHDDAAPPSRANPALPAAADAPILAMLEKTPERRPATVAAAFAALERGLSGATVRRRWPSPARALALAALLALAVCAVAAGVGRFGTTAAERGGVPHESHAARGGAPAPATTGRGAQHLAGVAAGADPVAAPPPVPTAPPRARTSGRPRPRGSSADPEDVENPYR